MTQYAIPADLLDGDLEEEDFTLPSGRLVRIRPLSRAALIVCGKGADGDSALIERRNVKFCLVEPRMSLEMIQTWQENSKAGGDFKALSERIRDLSGLGEGADKSSV